MWSAAEHLGFQDGRVLEPGCGAGTFIAHAPLDARMVGVEQDLTSAGIASLLYPDADIRGAPFERFAEDEPFDLVVGNVPFAKLSPADSRYNRSNLTLHNYFLAKSLQLLRPGGVMLALTSRYTLDARNPAARRELGMYADLIGALRLPSGSMQRIAGTGAILDLLVLRRRASGAEPAGVAGWDHTVEADLVDESDGQPGRIRMNRYLVDNPERILGTPVLGRAMYRDGDLIVRGRDGATAGLGREVRDGLDAIVDASDLRYEPAAAPSHRATARILTVGDVELLGDRRLPLREGSFIVSHTGVIYRYNSKGHLRPAEVGKGAANEVRALVELRDTAVDLLRLEADDAPDGELEALRQTLRERYDSYRRSWGPLNRVNWHRTGRVDQATGEEKRRRVPARLGGFREDPEWSTLAAIEVYDEETGHAQPAPILSQRTVHPPVPRLGADTGEEALAICLDELGRVDIDRIAELLGVDDDQAGAEIESLVFEDPRTLALVPSEEYLSGDVRAKLAAAQEAATTDPRFEHNVEALAAVQPAQVEPGDIVVRPGATWVRPEDVADFLTEVLEATDPKVDYLEQLGTWTVSAWGTGGLTNRWATSRMSGAKLLEACLNQRLVRITDEWDGKRVTNVQETLAARERQEEINQRFSEWVWQDPARAARLAEAYNDRFNSYVAPDYDGTHLTFPGLVSTFKPHTHQRAAVARILREGRALLAHGVGAGKTATMVMAGMELRRLGIVNRPTYVVPNHMLEQFGREFLQLYPLARVLSVTKDLTGKEGRKKFMARVATGDWDAVVITHSAFELVPLRAETLKGYKDEVLAAIDEALKHAQGLDQTDVKRMELARKQKEVRLDKVLERAAKNDGGVCFEDTGIDFLFVDELHLFKNKPIVSSVEGIRTDGSNRAVDLDTKLWHLHRTHGGRSLVGATATPIANAISELWIMQTYLQPDVLAEAGMENFDSWVATFAQQVAAIELAPDGGSYRMTSRLAKYQNVPELIAQFRRTADVRIGDDLDLKLPALRGGAAEIVVVPPSETLKAFVRHLVKRAEMIRNGGVDPKDDNMLKVTGEGRSAALDLRLVGLRSDPAGGKIGAAAERIAGIYTATRDTTYLAADGTPSPGRGGLQIVFCDLATPSGAFAWNAYDELRRRLVALGVPAAKVAFTHDARNEEARARLFADCRNGRIAVLVGSTEKMGVGTNIQARAVALHHLDCPWRPADIEQREGRILRQGNRNDEVQIIRYATGGSFDVYMWQTLERKAGFIGQVMRGDNVGRDIDDVGDAVLSFSEVKALASGNPLVIEQAGIQADLAKYERLERAHLDQQGDLQFAARQCRRDADACRRRAGVLRDVIARRVDTSGDAFTITIGNRRFTKRVDAEQALKDELRRTLEEAAVHDGEFPARDLGELGGFDIRLGVGRGTESMWLDVTIVFDPEEKTRFTIYPSDLGTQQDDAETPPKPNVVARLENPIHRLDQDHGRALQQIDKLTTEAEALEARIGEPFPHRDHLAHLRHRHQEIQAELAAQADAPSDHDDPPTPTDRLDNLKNRRPDDPSPEAPGL